MTAAKKKPAKPLPCPFCGCKPDVRRIPRSVWVGDKIALIPNSECFYVDCNSARCAVGPTSESFNTRAEAIAAWNRRAK